ncbi:ATP-grasp domain-containing protein [Mesorhizobium sp. M2A.F.Ca.ET.040.01.1.1]|nr:ATP-grasp domain-containing protein [Mesorhizobium sp. M2A.F.Ca.ET.040.01.1.1]
MTRGALILLDASKKCNSSLYVYAARCLGLRPTILSAHSIGHEHLAAEGVEVVTVDTSNLEILIRECSRLHDIVGISAAGHTNDSYRMASKLCQHFRLPGPDTASIERCCDKLVQRQFLADAGVPVIACRMAADAKEVESAAEEIGLPVIVRPYAGIGSTGKKLCRTVHELAEHTTYLLNGKYTWWSSPRILVEERVEGLRYSVHAIGDEIIGIGAADWGTPPDFVYGELSYPALLTNDQYERIVDICLTGLDALGLGWGPTSIECLWTKWGPVVVEVNPGIAGTAAPRLVKLAYGIDLITAQIGLAVGQECHLPRRQSRAAIIRHLVADGDGTLEWIIGGSLAASLPGVDEVKFNVEPDSLIVRRGDHQDYIGHIIAASSSLDETETIIRRAVGLISWSIKPPRLAASYLWPN